MIGEFEYAVFMKDFGVPMTFGDYQGKVLYDAPGTLVDAAGMSFPSVEHAITFLGKDFPGLGKGSSIVVNGTEFKVKKPAQALDDGVFYRAELERA